MKRREFIAVLGGAAAWPLVEGAQQSVKIYRLGYLAPARIPHLIDALLTGLRELGYVEGKNIKIECRYGGTATLDELAAQLVDLHPDAIITVATPQRLRQSEQPRRSLLSWRLPATQCGRISSPVSRDPVAARLRGRWRCGRSNQRCGGWVH